MPRNIDTIQYSLTNDEKIIKKFIINTNNLNDDFLLFNCPNPQCNQLIYVKIKEINCQIFRCGIFIGNNQQVAPHSSKSDCDKYLENNMIYGCARPFYFVKNLENVFSSYVILCDYI